MRALRRRFLAPLVMAAAFLAGAGPVHFAAGPVHLSIPLADCPLGTNWDSVTQTCQ